MRLRWRFATLPAQDNELDRPSPSPDNDEDKEHRVQQAVSIETGPFDEHVASSGFAGSSWL